MESNFKNKYNQHCYFTGLRTCPCPLIFDDDLWFIGFFIDFFFFYYTLLFLKTIDWGKHIRLAVKGLPTHTRHMLLVVCQVRLEPSGFGSSWICLSLCWVHSSSRLYYHPPWVRNMFVSVPPCLNWWLDCWWCQHGAWEQFVLFIRYLRTDSFLVMFSTAQWQLITFLSPHQRLEWPPVLIFFFPVKSAALNHTYFSPHIQMDANYYAIQLFKRPPLFADVKIAGLGPRLPPPTLWKKYP